MILQKFNFLFLFIFALSLPGCSIFSDPNKLQLTTYGNSELNPDVNGQPSPVDLLIFQLKSTSTFEAADFIDLYQNSKKTLGSDLIAQTRLVIKPDECTKKELTLDPLTNFIGIVVAFQNIDKAHYKQIAVREKIPNTGLNLKLIADDFIVLENQTLVTEQK